ncbi:MAG TPA: MlaD family protein [Rhizomicrobium sp.]|jgi:phospholipid/cholesterol/gamma-HCH transport system substrate-binding protein|nr:MlaD family protein [Rhizomicrobium sp.]
METKANYVAVGAFVLACMFGLVVTILWLAGTQNITYSYYTVRFEGSVTGLGKGTIVRYNGLEAGRVDDLVLDPKDPKVVITSIKVDRSFDIHEDATAAIASQGLTGGSYVELLGGSIGKGVLRHDDNKDLEKNPEIHAIPSTFEKLEKKLDQLSDKLNVTADRVNLMLDDKNRKAIADILANLDTVTTTVAEHRGDIDATLRNTNEATHNLAIASRDLHPTLVQADATLKKLDKLAGDADTVVTGDGVAQLSALIADSRRLVGSLTKLSDELNREPTRVIFGDRRKGYTPK